MANSAYAYVPLGSRFENGQLQGTGFNGVTTMPTQMDAKGLEAGHTEDGTWASLADPWALYENNTFYARQPVGGDMFNVTADTGNLFNEVGILNGSFQVTADPGNVFFEVGTLNGSFDIVADSGNFFTPPGVLTGSFNITGA